MFHTNQYNVGRDRGKKTDREKRRERERGRGRDERESTEVQRHDKPTTQKPQAG